MIKINFFLKNIITRPYPTTYQDDRQIYRIKPAYNGFIDYGDQKITMSIVEIGEYTNFTLYMNKMNWIHPSNKAQLCLGSETRYTINTNLSQFKQDKNKDKFIESMYHILNDYFSVCTDVHWRLGGLPDYHAKYTNDDFFICKMDGSFNHKRKESQFIKGVHGNNAHEDNIDHFSKIKPPYSFNMFKICRNCGSLNKKNRKKCFSCLYSNGF